MEKSQPIKADESVKAQETEPVIDTTKPLVEFVFEEMRRQAEAAEITSLEETTSKPVEMEAGRTDIPNSTLTEPAILNIEETDTVEELFISNETEISLPRVEFTQAPIDELETIIGQAEAQVAEEIAEETPESAEDFLETLPAVELDENTGEAYTVLADVDIEQDLSEALFELPANSEIAEVPISSEVTELMDTIDEKLTALEPQDQEIAGEILEEAIELLQTFVQSEVDAVPTPITQEQIVAVFIELFEELEITIEPEAVERLVRLMCAHERIHLAAEQQTESILELLNRIGTHEYKLDQTYWQNNFRQDPQDMFAPSTLGKYAVLLAV